MNLPIKQTQISIPTLSRSSLINPHWLIVTCPCWKGHLHNAASEARVLQWQ
jgi:hypothetical protein